MASIFFLKVALLIFDVKVATIIAKATNNMVSSGYSNNNQTHATITEAHTLKYIIFLMFLSASAKTPRRRKKPIM
jgi:hypothetical protein